ncbi:unnamed protein product [Tuber melanosporum]|uniref:(Perigord truffle) hypothetical protein n=1 Tax=Tuber melanosporum (strain Mel28) TaxID=656061 RepID=D5GKG7_TUBMM|nr:uncharacterized protein GSTUM_00009541001 [Tuber melanosporum]CAZ85010.1 unnamed protein product [Tuber melanosporum]
MSPHISLDYHIYTLVQTSFIKALTVRKPRSVPLTLPYYFRRDNTKTTKRNGDD